MIFLNENERKLMELLWEQERPLTGQDIKSLLPDGDKWYQTHILKILRNLEEKGLIVNAGSNRQNRHYSRLFAPKISKAEYMTQIVVQSGLSDSELSLVAVALVQKAENTEEIRNHLMAMLKELETRE